MTNWDGEETYQGLAKMLEDTKIEKARRVKITTNRITTGPTQARYPRKIASPANVYRARNGFIVEIGSPELEEVHHVTRASLYAGCYICETIDDVANILTMHYGELLTHDKPNQESETGASESGTYGRDQ